MFKKKILVIAFVAVFLLTGCAKENTDSLKFKEDYEALNGVETSTSGVFYRDITIDENNPIVYTSFKEIKEKIDKKESFLLYVGFSGCPWCRSVIPYFLEEAKKNNIDTVYYINVREDNTKKSDLRGYYKLDKNNNVVYEVYPDKYYHDVLDTLEEFLKPYTLTTNDKKVVETGENRLYAPSFIVYKNGEAVTLDECTSEKQTDGYQELSDEIISEMRDKINQLLTLYND